MMCCGTGWCFLSLTLSVDSKEQSQQRSCTPWWWTETSACWSWMHARHRITGTPASWILSAFLKKPSVLGASLSRWVTGEAACDGALGLMGKVGATLSVPPHSLLPADTPYPFEEHCEKHPTGPVLLAVTVGVWLEMSTAAFACPSPDASCPLLFLWVIWNKLKFPKLLAVVQIVF